MKITPEAVKERIAALESAGELSLKEQFYLEALRQLVAGMDSKPVALTANIERRRCKDRNCNKPIYGYSVDGLCEDCYTAISQQPAPVVPDDVRQALSKMDDEIIAELDAEENACRAAMLQSCNSPVVPDEMERCATTLEYIGNFAGAAIIRQLAVNQQQNAQQNIPEIIPDSCTWTFSNYDDHWSGTCGVEWIFPDGGPEENGVKFCPKCGKSVAISATE